MIKEIIDDVLAREGGSKATNDPNDAGGRTQYGIAERSNPQAWADGKVTEEEARAIYEAKYVRGPGFDKVSDPKLMAQLVDFGVNSGPGVAITKLQEILRVTPDGVLGPKTLEAISREDPRYLSNKLVAARIQMIGKLTQKNPAQLKWLGGWLNRALGFLQ
jgi:lysozyme family protein